jgi:hypothetical protein
MANSEVFLAEKELFPRLYKEQKTYLKVHVVIPK